MTIKSVIIEPLISKHLFSHVKGEIINARVEIREETRVKKYEESVELSGDYSKDYFIIFFEDTGAEWCFASEEERNNEYERIENIIDGTEQTE